MTLHIENRTARRRRVLKGGKIFYNNFCFSTDCTIRNESTGGMLLHVDEDALVPESFAIMSRRDGKIADARMVWRKGNKLGLQLLSELTDVQESAHQHIRQMSTMITH